MIRDDVVANARMDGHRHVMAECLSQDRGLFPAMIDDRSTGLPAKLSHRFQQIDASAGQGVSGVGGDRRGQLVGRRQRHSIFPDQFSERAAIAETIERSGHDRSVDIHRRLVPRPEGPASDVHFDAFGRRSIPSIFPVVNRARAVGGEMSEVSLGHQAFKDASRSVTQEVSSVDQHDRRAATASVPDSLGARIDQFRISRIDRGRRSGGIDQYVLSAS